MPSKNVQSIIFSLIAGLGACADTPADDDPLATGDESSSSGSLATADTGGTHGAASESGDGASDSGEVIDPNCVDDDFTPVGEFAGPGYDPDTGLKEPVQDTYLAHITVAHIRSDPALEERFVSKNIDLFPVLMQQEGLIGYQVGLSDKCKRGLTIGVWRSEQDMYAFVGTPEHVEAMSIAPEVLTGAGFHHFEIRREDLPFSFEAARELLGDIDIHEY